MGKVTIEDISRHTGLSRGTVSRALNDRPDISEQTKQRVLDACAELNYVPSLAARSLATGRRYATAILVDDLRTSFAAHYLRGVIARAQSDQYAVHVSELGTEPERAAAHMQSLVNERVDCVLLATSLPSELLQPIIQAKGGQPVVACAALEGLTSDVLVPDYAEAGRLMARHLLERGAGQPLFVYQTDITPTSDCRAGFSEVCRAAGFDPDSAALQANVDSSFAITNLDEIRTRLAHARVVAAANDFLAMELMYLATEAGRKPGRDIAIVGCGNEQAGLRLTPSLTTVSLSAEEVGFRSMDIALQRIKKERQDAAQHVLIAPELLVRESSQLAS